MRVIGSDGEMVGVLSRDEALAMTETALTQFLADAAPVQLRRARLARVLGIHVDDAEVERILRALGMASAASRESIWSVTQSLRGVSPRLIPG